jgi:hypothetical protein
MRRALTSLACLALATTLGAIYAGVDIQNVPIARIITNLEREIALRPKQAGVIVNLARIHAMAFAETKETTPIGKVPGGNPEKDYTQWLLAGVPPFNQFEVKPARNAKADATARDHLNEALRRYREALAVDPRHQVALLGFGWTLIQSGDRTAAIAPLRAVIEQTWPADQKIATVDHGQRSMTEEAAFYLIPLLDPERDRDELATLKARVAELERQPRAITPIAIPLAEGLTALDIEDANASVAFDADGTGFARRWTWIHPNAAWLVFDRHRTGRITSALQLFGSVAFWLFWDNGYEALRSLDDNGDGAIAGAELEGIALWHDRNANGVSERGEVRAVAEWGVASISCAYERDALHPGEIAWSRAGVRFLNGVIRPSFDVLLRRR